MTRSLPLVQLAAAIALLLGCTNSHMVIFCNTETECPAGSACRSVRQRVLQCVSDCPDDVFDGEHCSDGSQCISDGCFPAGTTLPGEPCFAVGECVEGYACSRVQSPTDPTCIQTCVGLHFDDTECPDGTICTQRSVCFPPCDPVGPACPDADDLCIRGECRHPPLCNDPELTRCPPGEVCDEITFECLDPVEFDRRYPRPEGGLCHAEGRCPLMTH